MRNSLRGPAALALSIALAASAPVAAQDNSYPAEQDSATVSTSASTENDTIIVNGSPPADLTGLERGPDVVGMISARRDDRIQITGDDRNSTIVAISEATQVRGSGGFLGLNRTTLGAEALLNGLPVTVETVRWGNALVASRVRLRNSDFRTASMIRNGTEQGFAEQTAATDALRSRVGDIDQYNVRRTTNVYFDTGQHRLSPAAEAELCATTAQAQATDNALLLVVGYTDEVGTEENNQALSERRAGRVVNYLQQRCRWAPYRMLTPSGMSEADPAADNMTEEGRAQNRRVAVSILVSKAVDGI
jgi:OmpA-OmpF porin, OOP family